MPRVALTFDAGSDAGEGEKTLAVLGDEGITATFFLTGAFIRANPGLVLRIVSAGHEIGNHTWSHPHLTAWDRTRRQDTLPGVGPALVRRELEATAQAFRELTGLPMRPLWRAPYGEFNDDILSWAADAGWTHVGWSRGGGGRTLDSLDWVADRSSSLYLDSAGIARRLLSFGAEEDGLNGGIVLMHLSTRREDPGVERLAAVIGALRGRGYRFATVSDLLDDTGDSPAVPVYRTAALLHE